MIYEVVNKVTLANATQVPHISSDVSDVVTVATYWSIIFAQNTPCYAQHIYDGVLPNCQI